MTPQNRAHTIREIAAALGAEAAGDLDIAIRGAAEPASAQADQLALAMDPKYADGIAKGQAVAALVWQGCDWQGLGLKAVIFAPRSRVAMSGLTQLLDAGPQIAAGVHAMAVVDPTAQIGAGAAIAFFQSIENFNITLFTRGNADTLTVYVFSKVRSGITPTINALALLLILFTLGLAVWYELNRRRKARIEAAREAEGRRAEEAALL